MPPRKLEPVALYWLDAAGAPNEGDVKPIPSVTVGFVHETTDEFIRIASENSDLDTGEPNESRDFTVVPKDMVLALRPLPKIPAPSTVYAYVKQVNAKKKKKKAR